jgi:hypothetical protein
MSAWVLPLPAVTRRAAHRYSFILALASTGLVFAIVAPQSDWARATAVGLSGLALVAVLIASEATPALTRVATGAAVARPGLEPGTPRFSVVGRNVSDSRAMPAIERSLAVEPPRSDVRKLRSFAVDLGTQFRLGAQSTGADLRRPRMPRLERAPTAVCK